ncbi:hypothetical protein PCI56_12910 [Plesiomonas shigelloides subsp. oncorhynchi]|nr:hypothetical protein [Plesiomonas shigelloides]
MRGSYAIELFAELRRLWTFGAPLFAGGRNVADMVPADYVSSRVHKATRRAAIQIWTLSRSFGLMLASAHHSNSAMLCGT